MYIFASELLRCNWEIPCNRGSPLYAANHSTIHTYGTRTIRLELGLRRNFNWKFIIADVKKPIIGADFIHYYGLIVDVKRRRIIDPLSSIHSLAQISKINTPLSLTPISDNIGNHSIVTLLRKFKDITVEKIFSPDTVKHNVTHVIETKGAPVTSKTRRLSTEKLKIAKDQFDLLRNLRPELSISTIRVCGTITQTFQ
ncbi:hypothetical protein PPYR_06566 [Photinus pyralis]|uniref:Uncharacterized protein n=1 Tax=Photinus pyralis TaxID=7054 RepID=A0A5N4AU21_PHOPY|nr:hypothetical protein PPYR_06566 [Photinus pyralis]